MGSRPLLLLLPLPAADTDADERGGAVLTAAQWATLRSGASRDVRRTLQAIPQAEVRPVSDEAALALLLSGARYTPERVVVVCAPNVPTLLPAAVAAAIDAVAGGSAAVAVVPTLTGGAALVAARADEWPLTNVAAWMTRVAQGDAGTLRSHALPAAPGIDSEAAVVALAQALMDDPLLDAPATRNVLRHIGMAAAAGLDVSPRWSVERQETLFGNARRTAVREHVRTHRGELIDYPYFLTPDAVRIVAVTSDGQVVFVRQYRLPIRNWSLEIPAGGIEADQDGDLLQTAARELREEVGGSAASWQLVGKLPSSTAHIRHLGHVVLALDVTLGDDAMLESTEDLVVVTLPLAAALEMARSGDLGDAESALALLMCEARIREWLASRGATIASD